MRRPSPAATIAALALMSATALSPAVQAQPSPAPQPPQPAAPQAPVPQPAPEAVIAKVGGDEIHYADLQDALQGMPEQLRQLPPTMLYPMLLDQLVDRQVIVQQARKEQLQDDPKVKAAIQRAANAALQNALLTREIQPMLTPEAIQARYNQEYAGKSGEEEVRAAHILVADEAKAKDIIAQLQKGGDFATLAKDSSTDPSAKQNNGELGWFKKTDMLPEFSDSAFSLKPGDITPAPVHTRFGWHVIKLEERRTAPAPTLDEVRDQIRQQIIQEGVARVLASAKAGVAVQKFNLDGTPMSDKPTPPSAQTQAPATPTPAPTPIPGK